MSGKKRHKAASGADIHRELTNRMCLTTLDEQNGTRIGLKQSMAVFLLVADDIMAVFIVLILALSPSALKTYVTHAFEHQVV